MPVYQHSPLQATSQPVRGDNTYPLPTQTAKSYPQPGKEPIPQSNKLIAVSSLPHSEGPQTTGVAAQLQPTAADGDVQTAEMFAGDMPGGFYVTVEKHLADGVANKHVTSTPNILRTGKF